MKKADFILLALVVIIASIGYYYMMVTTSEANATKANIFYNSDLILSIDLIEGDYTVFDYDRFVSYEENTFIVLGTNGNVVISYYDNGLEVIDETSPEHICQFQGFSNNTIKPLTCLPNNIIITFEGGDDDIDVISQ